MIIQRIVIARHERGLVLKDKQISDILMPGIYWRWTFGSCVHVLDINKTEINNAIVDRLLDSTAEKDLQLIEQNFNVIELDENELALVYQRKVLQQVLKSGTRHVFWQDAHDLLIKKVNTKDDYQVDKDLVNTLAKRSDILGLNTEVYATEVESKHLGLLWVNGELVMSLQAGVYAFWKNNRSIKVEHVELRLQSVEVAGQEILTRDKVSLRINLSANYQLADPVHARLKLQDYEEYLYRQLQFALREVVGTKTLDGLLADKEALNGELFRDVAKQMSDYGIKVVSVGVKDIILPGEMKEILNHVVATEKAAQANVIRRREETAATRSLLNTAKLMDENPTLMRLKEIEALEKVVEKVDKINVYDGLNGLLRDTVKLQV